MPLELKPNSLVRLYHGMIVISYPTEKAGEGTDQDGDGWDHELWAVEEVKKEMLPLQRTDVLYTDEAGREMYVRPATKVDDFPILAGAVKAAKELKAELEKRLKDPGRSVEEVIDEVAAEVAAEAEEQPEEPTDLYEESEKDRPAE